MHYLIISFSHKNSTLAQREKLAFADDNAKLKMLEVINAHTNINESMILSTCNRMEIYCSCSHVEEASEHLLSLLSQHSNTPSDELKARADMLDNYGAIHHFFSVASSLDSMIVGETQIAGQLKDAFKLSNENGYCGVKLARALQSAQKCAAEIRNATDISSRPVSIASVAVSKARECVGGFAGKRALVIGSGEMSVITCKHLSAGGADVTVMNRTFSKAEAIAAECGAKVRSYEEIAYAINEYPILFTSTGSLSPIITDAMIEGCSYDRYWFDMAVPRDIECHTQEWGIHLYVIDDLKDIVSANIAMREDEARASFVLISRHTAAFFEWLKALSIEPLIKNVYQRAYTSAHAESVRVIENGYLPKEYEHVLHKATTQALKRFLHPITEQMRSHSDPMRTDALIEALSFLMNDDQNF
ncbi:MAG: glutamyl-tRNA reductase [Sulfuricurvum sp.]|uniref:glutamyl-tRNA reductase n=1 Tax=Sulfuricurvum sp. TaxID=2025608 RepID=UPI00262357A8|nr:glutamyl-tRNA reductase [Sulfuricurvum sp.]MDD2828822.1 glutamyl-tRNA reductase [Sulfuricurvum sp.]MDD4948719.1 glutamyl-tRNA reductase [Sulfuricurvum sp.]